MNFEAIGFIETDFKEKFGIPRQPGLVKNARGVIRLQSAKWTAQELKDSIRGLEGFSHLWLIWEFHQVERFKPLIRPPRLGGSKKVGVLASRSPHRPNPIGLSLVKIEAIRLGKVAEIEVSGVDLLDQTPILDIKPYLPYADLAKKAKAGWAHEKIVLKRVSFSVVARAQIKKIEQEGRNGFLKFVRDFLACDPRPAFQHKLMSEGAKFGVMIGDWDVKFEVRRGGFWVRELV